MNSGAMEETIITKRGLEIRKKKSSDGPEVFEVSRKHFGTTGGMNTVGSEGGTYSSWDIVLEKIKDLNLPPRLLNAAKTQLDTAGFATISLV